MALRTVALRLGCKRSPFSHGIQFRTLSDGRVLSEEEKAAENIFIRKMEKEKLEKARKGLNTKLEEVADESSSSETKSTPLTDASTDSTKNIAVVAGVVAIVAAGWWYFRSNSKVKEEEKE